MHVCVCACVYVCVCVCVCVLRILRQLRGSSEPISSVVVVGGGGLRVGKGAEGT